MRQRFEGCDDAFLQRNRLPDDSSGRQREAPSAVDDEPVGQQPLESEVASGLVWNGGGDVGCGVETFSPGKRVCRFEVETGVLPFDQIIY